MQIDCDWKDDTRAFLWLLHEPFLLSVESNLPTLTLQKEQPYSGTSTCFPPVNMCVALPCTTMLAGLMGGTNHQACRKLGGAVTFPKNKAPIGGLFQTDQRNSTRHKFLLRMV